MEGTLSNNPSLIRDVLRDELQQVTYLKIVKVIILGLGFVIGYLSSGLLQARLSKLLTEMLVRLQRSSKERIIAGVLGFGAGTGITYIVLFPLYSFMKDAEANFLQDPVVRIGLYLVLVMWLGYFGANLAVNVFYPEAKADQLGAQFGIKGIPPKVLDTSAIIDGRIAEVIKTHFLEGVIVIPSSVLRELQAIADSNDHLRRAKGRRGLEILNDLRSNPRFPISIYDDTEEEALSNSVDEQLIRIAKNLGGIVVTNDFNLNKVATVQEVDVLNINELANAVKPMVVPNETLQVLIIKAGKEHGQGVGYLDDGTMVVIEGGVERLGSVVDVRVTSVMQTQAGRLIFARINDNSKEL
ncbi:MAG: TRAM domain-containing protein [bacterium]